MAENSPLPFCQKYTTRRDTPFIIYHGRGSSFPYHWHEEMEIVYVMGGTMSFFIGMEEYSLCEGDIINIRPAEIHRYESRKGCKFMTLEFGHYLDVEVFGKLNLISERIPVVIEHGSRYDQQFRKLMMAILSEFTGKGLGWDIMVRGLILELGALYLRFFSGGEPEGKGKNNPLRGYNEILHGVFEYIENNYEFPISSDEVAEIANISKNYFNKFFKRMTNVSFNKYVNDIRLEKASVMLMITSDTVTRIAFNAGFNSVRTFTRLFKEKYGVTPGIYRRAKDSSKEDRR